jgi:hypothetical protein
MSIEDLTLLGLAFRTEFEQYQKDIKITEGRLTVDPLTDLPRRMTSSYNSVVSGICVLAPEQTAALTHEMSETLQMSDGCLKRWSRYAVRLPELATAQPPCSADPLRDSALGFVRRSSLADNTPSLFLRIMKPLLEKGRLGKKS